jgi:hypothetical protein
MANSGIFPIFLRAEYREDGKGLEAFRSDAARAAAAAKAEFKGVAAALDAALSRPRNSGGGLDLGVDELRRAAQEQQRLAAAAREVAEATRRAATANGGFDASLSRATKSAFDYANAQERTSREMVEQIALLDRIQAELAQTASATNAAAAAGMRSAAVSGQQRQGLQNLSFQLNDIATQFALGASATQIFAAQSGQVIQAVQTMTGGTSRLAAFLGGPWALTSAAIVATPFIGKLLEGEKSADQLREALDKVNFVTNAMGEAQSVLGSVLDLTTGKLNEQTAATLTLARAQLQVQLVQARLAGKQAELTLRRAGAQSVEVGTERRFTGDRTGSIAIPIRRPTVSAAEAQRALGGDTDGALQRLLRLQEEGKITLEVFGQLSEAVGNLGMSQANERVLENALSALGGDQQALREFLKPKRGRQRSGAAEARRAAREAEQLANFGEQAAESIARLNAQFDEQPRLVDAAARATRELDAIIADLAERKPANFEALIADAERAKATVQSALVRPFEELRQESAQRLQIETLLAQGREDEAVALQEVIRLERQRGGITAEQRAEVEAIVRAEAERTRYLRDQQRLFAAQLDVVDQVQRSLTDVLSGRGGNFFGDFRQALRDLQGQRLFEDLFGEAFRGIRDDLQMLSPQGKANAAYAAEVEKTANATAAVGQAAISLAEQFDQAFGIVGAAANRTVTGIANDNQPPLNEIIVTAPRRAEEVRIARMSVLELANRLGVSIGAGIGAELEQVFGPRFAELFGDIAGGAIAGKVTGGNVGAVLGGATKLFESGILGNDNRISEVFGKATQGAATGTQVDGIIKALGIRGSATGAQIGGAIGSAIPIPGAAQVGAALGSIIGGLIKGTPRGSATIGGAGGSLSVLGISGNRGSLKDAAGNLAGSVLDAVYRIAEQLGAEVNAAAGRVSIGQRKDSLRVDPSGRGATKIGNGAIDFGDDSAAAIAFAVRDLINDGVITGLRQAEQNLLRAGKDVEAALSDVLKFRSVFDQLDEIRDPVGFAVRRLNREFEGLIDLFGRAGASAQELADLESLYDIRRAQAIEDATSRVTGSLKALLADLTIGDRGLSLRDRQGNALGQFNALAARVAAGDTGAFDQFAEVSQQLLDIERQLFGSTQAYFDRLQQVTALTEKAIADQTNVVSIGGGASSPFADSTSIARSIDGQTDVLASKLDAIIQNQIAAAGVRSIGGGGRGFDSPLPALVANF